MTVLRRAQIVGAVVVNVILADDTFSYNDGSILVASDTAQVGDAYAKGVFTTTVTSPVIQLHGLTLLQFMALFTGPEQQSIFASTDGQVGGFTLMAAASDEIDLDNAATVGFVQYLAAKALIANNRVAVVLAGKPPT